MFLALPVIVVVIIYIGAAVIPALLLMKYIHGKDTIEKEPPSLLLACVLMGVLAALAAIVAESLGMGILDAAVAKDSPYYNILLAFVVVAVVEEGAKLLLLKLKTWRNPNFNYAFDGIVYAVFVSLGFAAFENVSYIMGYGLSVAIPRALLAIPGHMSFAVFMGVFYGRAKECENRGDAAGKRKNLVAGYAIAVLLHGFYDACALIGTTMSTIVFVVFIAAMYFAVLRVIKHSSVNDRRIR